MTPWREDPKLQSRFHPDFPDDLQVLVRIQFEYDDQHSIEFLED